MTTERARGLIRRHEARHEIHPNILSTNSPVRVRFEVSVRGSKVWSDGEGLRELFLLVLRPMFQVKFLTKVLTRKFTKNRNIYPEVNF